MSMRDVIVTAMVDARHQWRAEGKEQSAWDDYNRFIADAVLAVLPLPSAEVIAAMRALRDYAVANSFFKFDHPAECATVDAYLAALEAAE